MRYRASATTLLCLNLVLVAGPSPAAGQDNAAVAAVRKSTDQLVAAFNAAKVDELSAMFLPQGELIDEDGTVYQGRQEIKDLLSAFFQKFPGSKLSLDTESIRPIGPVVIEEGTRTITTQDGATRSRFRYITVRAKTENGWQIASLRDVADDPVPTARDYLQPLAWLVGEWVNEGADGRVSIAYRWSDDKNFLLGEFQINSADGSPRKSSQRIGWDPSVGKVRSWLFDADGGFAEGYWTLLDDGQIVIKSTSVNPDGTSASATMTFTPDGDKRFTIQGTDRVVGDALEDDFEITITRRPPAAGK